MLLKSLKLNNIRSYKDETIVFPEGSTLLSGDIGSGKSTILLAIEFAFFGPSKGETTSSTLLRKGEDSGYIELNFNILNNNYIIYRSLRKKNDAIIQERCFLEKNNEREEYAPIELKSKILELLGYPKDLLSKKNMIYRFTVFTPQEEMKRIIFESEEDRLNTLRKVFGIDKYKRIRENSSLLIKKLKDQCKVIEGIIYDLPQKEEQLKKFQQQEKDYNLSLEPLNQINLELSEKISEEQTKFQNIKDKVVIFNNLNNKLQILDNKLSSALKQKHETEKLIDGIKQSLNKSEKQQIDFKEEYIIKEQKKVDDLKSEINEILAKQNEINILKESLTKNKENLDKEIKYISEKINNKKDLSKKIEEYELIISKKEAFDKEKSDLTAEIEKNSNELHLFEQNIVTSNDTISKIKNLKECPTCLQEVSTDHKANIVDNESEKIELNKEKIKDRSSKLDEKRKLLKSLDNELLKIQEYSLKLVEYKSELKDIVIQENLLIERNKILKEIDDKFLELNTKENIIKNINIEEKNKELEESKKRFEHLRKIQTEIKISEERKKHLLSYQEKNEKLNLEIIEINKEKILLNKEIQSYKDIENISKEKEIHIKKLETELKNNDLKITELKTKLGENLKQKEILLEEINLKKTQNKNLFKKQQYIDWLNNSFNNIVSIIEKHMLSTIYQGFDSLFQEWFDVMIEDELISAKIDANFTPLVQQNNYDVEIANLSGGEKTALALAYRLALNKVINDTSIQVQTKDLIILDEPTDGFSEHQLDKIREVLDKLNMKQVILVSHEEKINSFVDNSIKIVKENHVSRIQ